MMHIGLISDTHIPDDAKALPAQIKDVFDNADLILHAGDIYTVSVLDELERLAPVLAAQGDDDYSEVYEDRRAKEKHIITVEGITIWLTHIKPWSWPQHEKTPDVVVFGHTHSAILEKYGDILLINPGSPTFPNYRRKLGTVALLAVNSGKVEVSVVPLR
jgi:hypothetical protein